MSWSYQCIGKPGNVAAAIQKYADEMGAGQSKLELEAALPHLLGLLAQNFVAPDVNLKECLIDFEASGSGCTSSGKQAQRNCTVSIRPIWKTLV